MELKFGKYSFEGPFDGARFLFEKPGVIVVLCRDIREDGKIYLIDIDESEKVRSYTMDHPRQVEWAKACRGTGKLAIGVYYTDAMTKEERLGVVKDIKEL